MKKFKHYGKNVTVQVLHHSIEMDFEKQNLSYSLLPFVTDVVYKYCIDEKDFYAHVQPFEDDAGYAECVYILDKIPDDMDWKRLREDIKAQSNGEEPWKIKSRARVLYDEAVNMVRRNPKKIETGDFLDWLKGPQKEEIEDDLLTLGVTLEELKKMEHEDTPEIDEL